MAKETRFAWRLTAKDYFLGDLSAKQIRSTTKFPLRQENVTTAKDIIFHGGYQSPTKWHSLAVLSRQVNIFSLPMLSAK